MPIATSFAEENGPKLCLPMARDEFVLDTPVVHAFILRLATRV